MQGTMSLKFKETVEKLCSCKTSALVFLNMKHTVRIIIDSPSYVPLGLRQVLVKCNINKALSVYIPMREKCSE